MDPKRQILLSHAINLFPQTQFILNLTSPMRTIIYKYLAKQAENEYIRNPVYFGQSGVEHWLTGSNTTARMKDNFRKLAWKRGDAWLLSDVEALLALCNSDEEAKETFRTCSRTRTLMLDLTIDDAASLTSLTNYWTSNANQEGAGPFIDSLRQAAAQGPVHADICHLFSPLSRQLLYTYPDMSLMRNGRLPDCHWTSLNFFNRAPCEYYVDTRLAGNAVLRDYRKISAPYVFGDVLFYMHGSDAIHSCVYVADDIVFTKNGDNAVNPWMLAHQAEVSDVYGDEPETSIQGYRKKSLTELAQQKETTK
jgi:hypothetical protein